ncbi:MAG: ATP-binding protein [Bacteroidales bacterium]
MFIRVLFKNVLSFKEGTEFNLLPNNRKKLFPNHVYKDLDTPVMKATAIYGANGSGKSNILKGIEILKNIVLNKRFIEDVHPYEKYKFLLQQANKEPMSFAVEFSYEKQTFFYRVDVLNKIILKEELYHILPDSEDLPIFVSETNVNGLRKLYVFDDKGVEKKGYVDEKTKFLLKQNPMSSIMSLHVEYPLLKGKLSLIAYKWFKKGIKIIPLSQFNNSIIERLDSSVDLMKFGKNIISRLLPDIKDISIRKRNLNDLEEKDKSVIMNLAKSAKENTLIASRIMNNTIPELSIMVKRGEVVVKDLIFHQYGPNNYKKLMSSESQSEGTRQLIAKIPVLFDAFNNDTVVFIDELENGAHPLLIKQLLTMFLEDKKTKGQLVFTTHETLLLDQKIIRSDEVWFAEKREGSSKLYALSDFKPHQTKDVTKGYLMGRYGAIPFYNDSEILDYPKEI